MQMAQIPLPADIEMVRDVEFGKGGGRSLRLNLIRQKNRTPRPAPAVVFIHGGGWKNGTREMRRPEALELARRGFLVASIEYRLTDEAIFPAQIEDCKCAIRWVRAHASEWNVNPSRIGVWGTSAGGHLAALLGTSGGVAGLEGSGGWHETSSSVQAVASCFGPTDFTRMGADSHAPGDPARPGTHSPENPDSAVAKLLGGTSLEKPDVARRASPASYVSRDDPPFLFIHGDRDPVVPISQSDILHRALRAAGVESTFHVIPGGGHALADRESMDMIVDFFVRTLGAARKQD
jgi:acetyl esterase/lipase